MAISKDEFFTEPLTPEQEGLVHNVESLIDETLRKTYIGSEVSVRVRALEGLEDKRAKIEIARRYQAKNWKFRWYEDARDGDVHAVLR